MKGLLADLKELRNSKPPVEVPRNKVRMERIMEFQQANGISLNPNIKEKKKSLKRGGMFDGIVFCFPLIDPINDPSPDKLVQLAKGIYSQGGKLVQFSKDHTNKSVKYILIDQRSDVGLVRQALRCRIFYVAIINFRWVEESLRKLMRLEIAPFNLERDYKASDQVRPRKEQLQDDNIRKRVLSEFIQNKADKKRILVPKQIDKVQAIQKQSKQQQEKNQDSDSETVEITGDGNQNQVKLNSQQRNHQKQQNREIKIQHDCIIGQKKYLGQNAELYNKKIQEEDLNNSEKNSTYQSSFLTSNTNMQNQDELKYEELNEVKQQNKSIASDETQKMGSDEQNNTIYKANLRQRSLKKNPYFRNKKKQQLASLVKKQEREEVKQQLSLHPQVNRRKTKLALGSHQFSTNNIICQKLKQMQQIYSDNGNRKQYAYLRAIAAIRNYGKQIKNADQLKNIQGLGRQTIAKIREFLLTGSISKVENKLNKTNSVPHKELLRVYGIGLTTAQQLYHRGIRTIEDLHKNSDLLNKNQKMGLKYVQDFQRRIPRDKISRMLQFVKQILFYVARSDAHHDIEAVGSYRRGKATCGDIDILITRRDGYVEKNLLQNLVNELQKRKFITDHITQPKVYDGKKSINYMGVCKFEDQIHHRIDLKQYPVDQYAFALLYFTGSDLFNREMRMAANEKGLVLGDHGIRRIERNVGKPWKNNKIPVCYSEKDIFNVLEMDYRTPAQRQL